MRAHRVRALLMGGQACVFYGAAEFSRDTDFAILADAANLARLRQALADLQAEPIAVPPFDIEISPPRPRHPLSLSTSRSLADARGCHVQNARRGFVRQTLEAAHHHRTAGRDQVAICFRCPIWCRPRKPSATRTGR